MSKKYVKRQICGFSGLLLSSSQLDSIKLWVCLFLATVSVRILSRPEGSGKTGYCVARSRSAILLSKLYYCSRLIMDLVQLTNIIPVLCCLKLLTAIVFQTLRTSEIQQRYKNTVFCLLGVLIFQTTQWYNLNSIRTGVSHLTTRKYEQKVWFANGHLLLFLVMLTDKPPQFQEVACAFLNLTAS